MAKEIELLTANYEESRMTVAGANVVAGEFDQSNDVNGFHLVDAVIGAVVAFITKADRVKVIKQAALVIEVGKAVYFDITAREADKTNTNEFFGYCTKAAAAGDTHVECDFDGHAAFEVT